MKLPMGKIITVYGPGLSIFRLFNTFNFFPNLDGPPPFKNTEKEHSKNASISVFLLS